MLDSIRKDVSLFLLNEEKIPILEEEEYPCFLIKNLLTRDSIKAGAEGVYMIFSFSEYSHTHLLFVNSEKYSIINMNKPIDENGSVILDFLKNGNYSKEDIIKCLKVIFNLAKYNRKNLIQVIDFDAIKNNTSN